MTPHRAWLCARDADDLVSDRAPDPLVLRRVAHPPVTFGIGDGTEAAAVALVGDGGRRPHARRSPQELPASARPTCGCASTTPAATSDTTSRSLRPGLVLDSTPDGSTPPRRSFASRFVLAIASPRYKERAEGRSLRGAGRPGVNRRC
jgi:hypothetical protein